MSTEIIKQVFPETLKILSDLIAFKTISGENNNSLIDLNGAFTNKSYKILIKKDYSLKQQHQILLQ